MEPGYYWVREKKMVRVSEDYTPYKHEWQGDYWPWEIGKILKNDPHWVKTLEDEYVSSITENVQLVGPLVLPEPSS